MMNINNFWGIDRRTLENRITMSVGFDDPLLSVTRKGAVIYFNAPVWVGSISRLIELSGEIMAESTSQSKPKYTIMVNSYGGDVNEMFRFVDYFQLEILNNTDKPTSIVSTMAASAGSVIAAPFPNRYITPRGTIMIHELFAGTMGSYTEVKGYLKTLDHDMDCIVDIYHQATKQTKAVLRKDLLSNQWFGASEALEYGLVQKIL